MKGLLALSFVTLAVGCASAPPPQIAISHYQVKAAVIDTRAASKLEGQLARCGRNQECRADRIARYHNSIAPLPGTL